jgi:hypothetical protein
VVSMYSKEYWRHASKKENEGTEDQAEVKE